MSKQFVPKEVSQLLDDGETLESWTPGVLAPNPEVRGTASGAIVATDLRIVNITLGRKSRVILSIPYDEVVEIRTERETHGVNWGGIGGQTSYLALALITRDAAYRVIPVDESAEHLVSVVKPLVAPKPAETAPDEIGLLKALATLHDSGVLTDKEFESKKREVLDRL